MLNRALLLLSILVIGSGLLISGACRAQTGNSSLPADSLQSLGVETDTVHKEGSLEEALANYQSALTRYRAKGDFTRAAEALRRIGTLHYESSNLEAALKAWEEALLLYRRYGPKNITGEILKSIGWIYDDLAEYQTALKYYRESLQIASDIQDDKLASQCLNNIGVVYNNLSLYPQALEYYRQSLELRRRLKDVKAEASTLNNIGMVYDALSDQSSALDYYRQSLEKYTTLRDSVGIARVLGNLGVAYEKLTNYPKALEYHRQSLVLNTTLGNRRGEGAALNNLGLIYDLLSDHRRALDYYRRSLAIAHEMDDRKGEAETLDNMGIAWEALKDYSKALDYHQQSLAIRRELGDASDLGATLNNLGNVYEALGDYPQALGHYQQDLEICKRYGDDSGASITLANLGALHVKQGKYLEAREQLRQAIRLSEQTGNKLGLQHAWIAMGRSYTEQNQDSLAIPYFRKVLQSFDQIRGGLGSESLKRSYAQGVTEVYQDLVAALLRLGKTGEAFEACEQSRARAFLDLIGSPGSLKPGNQVSRTTNTIRTGLKTEDGYSDLASTTSVNALTFPEVQRLIGEKTTILEYFVTDHSTFIWVLTQREVRFYQINISSDSLKYLVLGFRDAIAHQGAADKRASILYNRLIKPVATWIQTSDLVIVPHGVLHYLPFQALKDSTGEYLVDKFSIRYLPSASVMKYLPAIPKPSTTITILALGNPKTNRPGYNPLALAEKEAKNVARDYPGSKVLTGVEASEDRFRQMAPEYSILHLACHGDLDASYPMYSSLLLAPGGSQDGDLQVQEVFHLKWKAWLVVLSACQTGLGFLTSGEDLVGLSRAVLYAGTPSVVVSQWRVEDESTNYLMTRFYHYLKQNDKAQSLRLAQQETRRKYNNIYSWAAFILVGQAQ